jgi:hypothetical protein
MMNRMLGLLACACVAAGRSRDQRGGGHRCKHHGSADSFFLSLLPNQGYLRLRRRSDRCAAQAVRGVNRLSLCILARHRRALFDLGLSIGLEQLSIAGEHAQPISVACLRAVARSLWNAARADRTSPSRGCAASVASECRDRRSHLACRMQRDGMHV